MKPTFVLREANRYHIAANSSGAGAAMRIRSTRYLYHTCCRGRDPRRPHTPKCAPPLRCFCRALLRVECLESSAAMLITGAKLGIGSGVTNVPDWTGDWVRRLAIDTDVTVMAAQLDLPTWLLYRRLQLGLALLGNAAEHRDTNEPCLSYCCRSVRSLRS